MSFPKKGTYVTVDAQIQISGRIVPLAVHLNGWEVEIEDFTVKDDLIGPWMQCFEISIDKKERRLYLVLDKLHGFRYRWYVETA
jgi:hypothetical protein